MIGLARTELIALQDEAQLVLKSSKSKVARAAARNIIEWLELALKRRLDQVHSELRHPGPFIHAKRLKQEPLSAAIRAGRQR
jgi:hypothetical protein